MPGQNPDELVVAGGGAILTAPEGATFPDDIADTLDAAWVDLGYATEAGVRFTFDRTTKDIPAWPSFDPVRVLNTAVPKTIEYDLEQWNAESLRLGLGGGTISATATGFMYEPPEPGEVDVRGLIIQGVDGNKNYWLCFRRVQLSKALSFAFTLTDIAPFAIGQKVLAAGDDAPFFILTDDPAFNDIGS